MKQLFLAAAVAFVPTLAVADGFVMGAGRWTCGQALNVSQTGSPIEKGQLIGWLLGFWSAATFEREVGFVDTVEKAGGEAIYNATLQQCAKAPADTVLFRVVRSMIENTK